MDAETVYLELTQVEFPGGFEVEVERQVTSTQALLVEQSSQARSSGGPVTRVLVAVEQTQGRGRHDRAWGSPPGGLWFSLIQKTSHLEGLSLLAGLALVRSVPLPLRDQLWLRWPNDVMVGRRKLAGVLVDARWAGQQGTVVVGIGINVDIEREHWSPEMKDVATTLTEEGLPRPHLGQLLLAILKEWQRLASLPGVHSVQAELSQLVIGPGREVEVHDGTNPAYRDRMSELGPDGALVLASGRRLYSVERLVVF